MNNNSTDQFQFQSPFIWSDYPKYGSNTSLENAYKICQEVAQKHYENFPVASFIIPKKIRKHFYSIYAFARYADNIADEKSNLEKSDRLAILNKMRYFIENLDDEEIVQYPILLALRNTIKHKQLPATPFLKLLRAFELDINFKQPETFEDLIKYCEYSANPIGELILRLFDEYTPETAYYSDKITTALQLINFWQDLSIDLHNKRLYLPADLFNKYAKELDRDNFDDFNDEQLKEFTADIKKKFNLMFLNLFEETEKILLDGRNLVSLLNNKRLQFEIKLIVNSAKVMLEAEKQYRTLLFYFRPKLMKRDYFKILLKSIIWKY